MASLFGMGGIAGRHLIADLFASFTINRLKIAIPKPSDLVSEMILEGWRAWRRRIFNNHVQDESESISDVLRDGFLLGVPKKKTSKRVKRHRTKLKIPKNLQCIIECRICGEKQLQNHLCLNCLDRYRKYVAEMKSKITP